jgi:DNA-directed RNA polymerase subunit N (RpoN/RPB10)
MIDKGLPCVTCGEPVWATFEEVARRSGKTESEIDLLIEDLKSHIQTGEGR